MVKQLAWRRFSSPVKTERAFMDESVISLSDDSIENGDEFFELRTGLACNSANDVKDAINEEFDYLVSLGIAEFANFSEYVKSIEKTHNFALVSFYLHDQHFFCSYNAVFSLIKCVLFAFFRLYPTR